jgi:hypothetical protein
VKRDRNLVDGRGNAVDDPAAVFACCIKKTPVEGACNPISPEIGMNPGKVDIGLVRKGLGQESHKESHNLPFMFDHKACVEEMDKEEPGEHVTHIPTAPPYIQHGNNRLIIRCRSIP